MDADYSASSDLQEPLQVAHINEYPASELLHLNFYNDFDDELITEALL